MDLEQLNERYPNGIPFDLEKGVSLFRALSEKSGVLSVRLMSNFGRDLERSLDKKTEVYKGVIVQVSPRYNLDDSDRLWFHPELTKARSVYKGKYTNGMTDTIGKYNSNVGTYSTYDVDELGGQQLTYFTIVDTASELASTTTDHWIATRSDIKSVYSDYKTNKHEGKTLQQASQATRDDLGGKSDLTSEYVSLFKGATSYHFYNHAIKSEGEALVLQSSLMGYSKVSQKGDLASDAMSDFMDVNELSAAHRNRVYKDCKWGGFSLINTYIMRKGESVKGEPYRMVNGIFSPNEITGLDAATTLKLTPTRKNIPASVECDEYAKRDIIQFAADEETMLKVLNDHWRQMVSSKYLKGDVLLLPRSIVEKSLI